MGELVERHFGLKWWIGWLIRCCRVCMAATPTSSARANVTRFRDGREVRQPERNAGRAQQMKAMAGKACATAIQFAERRRTAVGGRCDSAHDPASLRLNVRVREFIRSQPLAYCI